MESQFCPFESKNFVTVALGPDRFSRDADESRELASEEHAAPTCAFSQPRSGAPSPAALLIDNQSVLENVQRLVERRRRKGF
jgi:hypothetical protein